MDYFANNIDKSAYIIDTHIMVREHVSGMKVSFDPSVKTMVDSLATILGAKITYFSLNKEESLVGYHSSESDYCSLVQRKLGLIDRCNKQDKKACLLCQKNKKGIVYQCHAGLMEIMLPIVKNDLIGFAILGQFRSSDAISESILKEWKDGGFEEEELIEAYLERPYFDAARIEAIKVHLESIIDLQVKAERLHLKRPELLEELYNYIDMNIERDITLKEVARAISRSQSTIMHRLKESTGKTFKDLLIDKRLDLAEEIIKQDPDIAFKEVSARVGYQDSLYLSRIYKKKRGITLSEYKNRIGRS